jgi:hypothetical protein
MSEIVITTLAERPEYRERLCDFADAWPEFKWFADLRQGRRPTVSSALEILIRPSHLGRGPVAPDAGGDARGGEGEGPHDPVRAGPAEWQGGCHAADDGVRRTGQGRRPADRSVVAGACEGGRQDREGRAAVDGDRWSLAEWREWTGLPFDTTGDVIVPKALVPVHVDVTHDHAVYVEPNVWVQHDL